MIGSMAAVMAFLGFLFFAVQLLFNLYATSVVTANGMDAARSVAAYQGDHPDAAGRGEAIAAAEAEVRSRTGPYGRRLRFDWSGTDADVVRLHIEAENPHLLAVGSTALPFTHIDRTIEVRVERFR